MKFLKESEYDIKDETLKISAKCKQFSSSEQAYMLGLVTSGVFNDRIKLSKYTLENFVSNLTVNGSVVDCDKFAKYADLSDKDTLSVYLAVGELCSIANNMQDEEIKK